MWKRHPQYRTQATRSLLVPWKPKCSGNSGVSAPRTAPLSAAATTTLLPRYPPPPPVLLQCWPSLQLLSRSSYLLSELIFFVHWFPNSIPSQRGIKKKILFGPDPCFCARSVTKVKLGIAIELEVTWQSGLVIVGGLYTVDYPNSVYPIITDQLLLLHSTIVNSW